jgi:hypothetical protein
MLFHQHLLWGTHKTSIVMARFARLELRASALGGWVAICAVVWLAADPGFAQAPQPQSAPAPPAAPQQQQQQVQQPPQPQQEAPRKREGFLDALGRWFDKSARDFKAGVDEANAKWRASVEETNAKWKASADESNARWKAGVDENNAKWRELGQRTEKAAKEAAAAQKEAAEAFKNLANTRMIEGRQVCEPAPNGSPDCQAAAEVICKGKGFATGKSADITTSRKCSARALLHRDDSECRTETVVIKAACQ